MSAKRSNLVITRKLGQSIDLYVGEEKITITLLDQNGGVDGCGNKQRRLCINANPEVVKVLRSEKGDWDGLKKRV